MSWTKEAVKEGKLFRADVQFELRNIDTPEENVEEIIKDALEAAGLGVMSVKAIRF